MKTICLGQRAAPALLAVSLLLSGGCLGGCSATPTEIETAPPAQTDTIPPAEAETAPPTAPQPEKTAAPTEAAEPTATSRPVQKAAPRKRAYSEEEYNETVDKIVGKLSTDSMTERQKCRAVYDYVKGHVAYTGSSDKSDWKKAAYSGFTARRGDCFTYYACARALLTALGIENQEVRRSEGVMTSSHYWNLVNYGEGWYHFDCCPHLKTDPRFECFMATDQELLNFDAGAGRGYYSFDADAYPERVGGRADPNAVQPMPHRRGDAAATPSPEPTPLESGLPLGEIPPVESWLPGGESVLPSDPLAVTPDPAAEASALPGESTPAEPTQGAEATPAPISVPADPTPDAAEPTSTPVPPPAQADPVLTPAPAEPAPAEEPVPAWEDGYAQ